MQRRDDVAQDGKNHTLPSISLLKSLIDSLTRTFAVVYLEVFYMPAPFPSRPNRRYVDRQWTY